MLSNSLQVLREDKAMKMSWTFPLFLVLFFLIFTCNECQECIEFPELLKPPIMRHYCEFAAHNPSIRSLSTDVKRTNSTQKGPRCDWDLNRGLSCREPTVLFILLCRLSEHNAEEKYLSLSGISPLISTRDCQLWLLLFGTTVLENWISWIHQAAFGRIIHMPLKYMHIWVIKMSLTPACAPEKDFCAGFTLSAAGRLQLGWDESKAAGISVGMEMTHQWQSFSCKSSPFLFTAMW